MWQIWSKVIRYWQIMFLHVLDNVGGIPPVLFTLIVNGHSMTTGNSPSYVTRLANCHWSNNVTGILAESLFLRENMFSLQSHAWRICRLLRVCNFFWLCHCLSCLHPDLKASHQFVLNSFYVFSLKTFLLQTQFKNNTFFIVTMVLQRQ